MDDDRRAFLRARLCQIGRALREEARQHAPISTAMMDRAEHALAKLRAEKAAEARRPFLREE